MPLDYETLKLIWWGSLVLLFIGFALMDGFDLGVCILLPWVAKTDEERRVVINVVGPTWEGNQVWLVLGGGAIFAAWPLVYAAGFSVFYIPLILTLFALFLRPVGFDYRSKLTQPAWRNFWDFCLFIGGLVPSLIFGVAVGNLFTGVSFKFDSSMRIEYGGQFTDQLNPFALYCGITSVVMLAAHGGSLLALRTQDTVYRNSRRMVIVLSLLQALLFIGGGFFLQKLNGLHLSEIDNINQALTPFQKKVSILQGGWLLNYSKEPLLWLLPCLGILGSLMCSISALYRWQWLCFLSSCLSIIGILCTSAASLFPFLLPSSTDVQSSLTVWDASSSHKTLWVMLCVTIILLPIVIAYTSWVYHVLRGPITVEKIRKETHTAY